MTEQKPDDTRGRFYIKPQKKISEMTDAELDALSARIAANLVRSSKQHKPRK